MTAIDCCLRRSLILLLSFLALGPVGCDKPDPIDEADPIQVVLNHYISDLVREGYPNGPVFVRFDFPEPERSRLLGKRIAGRQLASAEPVRLVQGQVRDPKTGVWAVIITIGRVANDTPDTIYKVGLIFGAKHGRTEEVRLERTERGWKVVSTEVLGVA